MTMYFLSILKLITQTLWVHYFSLALVKIKFYHFYETANKVADFIEDLS